MANRSWHINAGLVTYIVTILILIAISFFDFTFERDSPWLLVAFLMALFGAQFPDLDQMWKKIFGHRDWLLHSSIPSILMVVLVVNGSIENKILYPILALFNLGVASHLLLDYFPTWEGDHDKKLEFSDVVYATTWVFDGITGSENIQKMVGTYLIHFPGWVKSFGLKRNTLTKIWTRVYLLVNALILIGISVFLLFRFEQLS